MNVKITSNNSILTSIVNKLEETQSQFENMSKKMAELLAKAFVARARKRLIAFTGSKRYSYYIKAVNNGEGHWSVVLNNPKYDPYIMYFLEYGTGFVGKRSEQNPDKPASWKYTVNKGASWYGAMTLEFGKQEGWFFNYRPNHFVQEEDGDFTNKNTGQRVIFTSGIKPVMYIYKTKVEIQNLLRQVKGKSYKEIERRLNSMINSSTMDIWGG